MALSKAKKKRVWESSDKHCAYCGKPLTFEEMTLDHVIPKAGAKKGFDPDREDNLRVACRTCNAAKGNMPLERFIEKAQKDYLKFSNIEKEREKALKKVEKLTKQIEHKDFTYIRYLRTNLQYLNFSVYKAN